MTDAVLTLFQWHNLLYLLLGTSVGIVVEGIPGLTSTMLIALTLPLTFQMDPVSAMTLLIGEYVGGISGGLVTAILLRMPGTPSSIVTTFDGYPMAQQGKAQRALALGIFASVVGGLISWAFLAGMSPSLARFALGFGPWEYCTLVLAALFMLAALTQGSLVRGLLGAAVGMALSLPGIDPSIGTPRLTFGSDALLSGTARGHGDRDFQPALPMPKGVPTLAMPGRSSCTAWATTNTAGRRGTCRTNCTSPTGPRAWRRARSAAAIPRDRGSGTSPSPIPTRRWRRSAATSPATPVAPCPSRFRPAGRRTRRGCCAPCRTASSRSRPSRWPTCAGPITRSSPRSTTSCGW